MLYISFMFVVLGSQVIELNDLYDVSSYLLRTSLTFEINVYLILCSIQQVPGCIIGMHRHLLFLLLLNCLRVHVAYLNKCSG
jgi:putative effector of murein hydrolase LrgA (UPF0299 family)